MTREEYVPWRERSEREYATEIATSRDLEPDAALAQSAGEFASLLPDDLASPGMHLFTAVVADEPVGIGWIELRQRASGTSAYVFDIRLDEDRRGQGLGRGAAGGPARRRARPRCHVDHAQRVRRQPDRDPALRDVRLRGDRPADAARAVASAQSRSTASSPSSTTCDRGGRMSVKLTSITDTVRPTRTASTRRQSSRPPCTQPISIPADSSPTRGGIHARFLRVTSPPSPSSVATLPTQCSLKER